MEPENDNSPAARPKRRITSTAFTVGVDANAHRQVEAQAKKLQVSKSKYASAAISFFAERGLDPTKEHMNIEGVAIKVGEGVANVRAHNADIGNRLFALTRSFEKTIYLFMQQQEHNMNLYLEGIEGNIIRRLVSIEDNLLLPLIERVLRGAGDAYIGRSLGERIYLEILKQPASLWKEQDDMLTGEREQVLIAELRKLMTNHAIPAAKSTRRPAATPVPPKPVTPAGAPATTPGATPPKS